MAREEQQPMSDARLDYTEAYYTALGFCERQHALLVRAQGFLQALVEIAPNSEYLDELHELQHSVAAEIADYYRPVEPDPLLAEVERLRAREAALVAIVERVAEAGVGDDDTGTWLMFSGYDAETVRMLARALLASTATDASAAASAE